MADDLELLESDLEEMEDPEDPFLGGLGGKVKKIAAEIARKCGKNAGTCALGILKKELLGGILGESDLEGDLEDPFLGGIGNKIKNIVTQITRKCGAGVGKCALGVLKKELGFIGGLLGESDMEEFEGDLEDPFDFEGDTESAESVPAEMAVLAQEAADAESDAEADAFIGALAGLLPSVLPAVGKFLPKIVGGIGKLFGRRRRRPRRAMAEAMPTIAIESAKRLAKLAAAGGDVSQAAANRVIGGVAGRVLGNRPCLVRCIRRCRRLAASQRARTAA